MNFFYPLCLLLTLCCLFFTPAYAQDEFVKFIKEKRVELMEKEKTLKKEEERLEAIKRDVDQRTERYGKLLSQIESILERIEDAKDKKIKHVVKTYEAMPAEEAAERLSALDEPTAVEIILKMNSKKAGAIMALMNTKKVVSITKEMTRIVKNFPTK